MRLYILDKSGSVCGPYSQETLTEMVYQKRIFSLTKVSTDRVHWYEANKVGFFPALFEEIAQLENIASTTQGFDFKQDDVDSQVLLSATSTGNSSLPGNRPKKLDQPLANNHQIGHFSSISITAIGFVAFAVVVLLLIICLGYGKFREAGRRTACANNLKQIGLALIAYSQDHSNCFPHTGASGAVVALAHDRVWRSLNDFSVYVCDGDKFATVATTLTTLQGAQGYNHCSYAYVRLHGSDNAGALMVADDDSGNANAPFVQYRKRVGNVQGTAHDDDGGNALFRGGYVKFCTGTTGVLYEDFYHKENPLTTPALVN